jgi:hypothetical protein
MFARNLARLGKHSGGQVFVKELAADGFQRPG